MNELTIVMYHYVREIKDSGNHEDLLIQSEAYKSFYQKQIKSH